MRTNMRDGMKIKNNIKLWLALCQRRAALSQQAHGKNSAGSDTRSAK
jgi:hypothetical protein